MMLKPETISKWFLAAAMVAFGTYWDARPLAAQPAPAESAEGADGVEVLTRGPVHEAFAGTISFDPQPGAESPKAPPEPIEELPPEQTLEGDNVAWIPGYWAWDDERDDFLWVSGIWRALPPGRQWVPGYWAQADQGFQWTSGYWADAAQEDVEYLAEPPASLEQGPNIAAPSADHIWLPGCWVWQQARYSWRPGYWSMGQPNWAWVPAYYTCSPRGYVFVNGYWDYSVARRGILFAPIYVRANVYSRRGFSYSPAIVISAAVFSNQLFLRPNYHHYYFGDYYASNYNTRGFYPWFSFNTRGRGYDPFYSHQRWQNRQNRDWEGSVQARYKNRVEHEGARPPRTFVAQQKLSKSGANSKDSDLVIATPLNLIGKDGGDTPVKLRPVKMEERQQIVKRGQDVQQFRKERQKLEAHVAVGKDDKPVVDVKDRPKMKLPKSPIVAKAEDKADQAPPKAPDQPAVDTKVQPKARKVVGKENAAEDNPANPKGKSEGRPARVKAKNDAPQDEPATVPKRDPRPVPKAKVKAQAGQDPKPQPDPTPDPKPEPEPKPEPKPDPKPDPVPDPKTAPMPQPKPKIEPNPKPMPTPKAEPKPEPKRQPKQKPERGPKKKDKE